MLLSTPHNSPPLPEDVPSLQALVREQQAALVAHREQLKIEKLGRERAELKVKDLLRRIFGPKSERISALQGLLFGVVTATETATAAARDALKRSRKAIKAISHGGGRRAAPENLPVLETVRIDLPAEQKAGLVWMRDEVSYEHDYQPSQFFRREIIRPMYVHPRKAHGPLIAPMPARVIPQSMVGPESFCSAVGPTHAAVPWMPSRAALARKRSRSRS